LSLGKLDAGVVKQKFAMSRQRLVSKSHTLLRFSALVTRVMNDAA
jgi:hypothetical protein